VKTFEKFLTESQKPVKGFGDAQFKTGTFDMANTQGQFRKSKSKEITKRIENLANKNKNKKNVIPNNKPPETRYDSTEPYMDDDLGQRTGKTGDKVVNKQPSQTGSKVIDKSGKTVAYKGKNVPVVSSTPDETMIKGIKDTDLEKTALDQTRKDLIKTNTVKVDQKPKVETPKTNTVKVDQKLKVDTPKTNTVKVDQKSSVDDLIRTQTTKTDISKQISRSRELKRLGFGDKDVVNKIDKKIVSLKPNVNITNRRILSGTTDAAKRYRKLLAKARAGRVLRTFGKGAGALTSYLDFKATADKERLKGRSKTSQNIAGLSRALGGYLGGALGVAAAAPIPIPGARIVGAAGGYTAGAKAGEELYNIGRKLVTGRGFSGGDKIKQTYTNFKNMLTRKK